MIDSDIKVGDLVTFTFKHRQKPRHVCCRTLNGDLIRIKEFEDVMTVIAIEHINCNWQNVTVFIPGKGFVTTDSPRDSSENYIWRLNRISLP